MDALAQRLVASDFDLRSLVRDICNSRVYQLSSQPNASNKLDTRQFSRSYLRRLRADVLMDSFVAVTGMERGFNDWPKNTKAIDFYPRTGGDTARAGCGDVFMETFGRSPRKSVSSTETKLEPTLSQTLHLMVGNTLEPRLGANGRLNRILKESATPEAALEQLFILSLSRTPTAAAIAAPARMPARPMLFRALTGSTRGAAFPTSPSRRRSRCRASSVR